jgi:hypothetical protein
MYVCIYMCVCMYVFFILFLLRYAPLHNVTLHARFVLIPGFKISFLRYVCIYVCMYLRIDVCAEL